MAKTPDKIGGWELHKASRGPVAKSSGCGFYRNRKKDKKLSRREGKSACNA